MDEKLKTGVLLVHTDNIYFFFIIFSIIFRQQIIVDGDTGETKEIEVIRGEIYFRSPPAIGRYDFRYFQVRPIIQQQYSTKT